MKQPQAAARAAGDSWSNPSQQTPGRQTLVDASYATPANEVIQRQEVPGPAAGAAAPRAELARIVAAVAIVQRNVDPDGAGAAGVTQAGRYTNRLQRLAAQLEELRPAIDALADPALQAEYQAAQEQLVVAFQTLAVYHAEQTLQAWSNSDSDVDKGAQRDQYQKDAKIGGTGNEWCGMFVNAQYRDAGFHGSLSMVFNSAFHAHQFFTYGVGSSNSPDRIEPHGTEARRGVEEYHQERGSLRSWLEREAVGHDLRPGDVVTLDWVGPTDEDDADPNIDKRIDHVVIVRSYTPGSDGQSGVLVTIDGNSFGARKYGAAAPQWDALGPDGYAALSGDAKARDVSTSRYEREAVPTNGELGDHNTGPAFDRGGMMDGHDTDYEMTIFGRGRPSVVDFETDHVYYKNFIDDRDVNDTTVRDVGRPTGPIQRSETGAAATGDPTAAFEAAASGAAGELPYRDEMQRAFGADFSSVRAFTGRDLSSLGAHAATRGDQIAFASGSPDRETVAHELTHVMQARTGRTGAARELSDPGDASEHEARTTAASIASGGPAPAGGASSPAAIHRQEDPTKAPKPPEIPAVHLPAGSGGANRLDWNKHFGISMTLPNGGDAQSIRQIYEAALLGHLQEQLPALCAGHAIPPAEDRGLTAAAQRHEAVAALGAALVEHEVTLRKTDEAGADDVRHRLFIAHQYAIVDALNVEGSPRYAATASETFCNYYAYDVVTAMGGYLPRVWWNDDAITKIRGGATIVTADEYLALSDEENDKVVANHTDFVTQVNANAMMHWMRDFGVKSFGWVEVFGGQAAQDAANANEIVIILGERTGKNEAGKDNSGHVNVVLATSPETGRDSKPDPANAKDVLPLQSQAGGANFEYSNNSTAIEATRAWWKQSMYADAGLFVYRGALDTEYAIDPPDQLGTADAGAAAVTGEAPETGESTGS